VFALRPTTRRTGGQVPAPPRDPTADSDRRDSDGLLPQVFSPHFDGKFPCTTLVADVSRDPTTFFCLRRAHRLLLISRLPRREVSSFFFFFFPAPYEATANTSVPTSHYPFLSPPFFLLCPES